MSADFKLRIYLFGLSLIFFSLTLRFHNDSVMDYQIFELTRSIVETRSLALKPSTNFMDFDLLKGQEKFVGRPGKNGEIYSPFGLLSILNIPFYLIGKLAIAWSGVEDLPFLMTQFSAIFWLAVLIQILFFLGRKFSLSSLQSFCLALSAGLCSPLWHQSTFINRDLPASTLGLLAFAIILHKRGALNWKYCFLAGMVCGTGLLVKSIAAVYFLPLTVFIWFHSKNKMHVLAFGVALCLMGLIWGWYNYYRFGDLFHFEEIIRNSTLGREPTPLDGLLSFFSHSMSHGIFGLLFGIGNGLFIFCPALVLLFFTSYHFYKQHKLEWLILNCIFISALLIYSKWKYWHSPGLYGPWFLASFIPCLWLQLAPVFKACKQVKTTALLVLLLSVILQIITVLPAYPEFYSNSDIIFQSYGTEASSELELLDQRMLYEPSQSPIRGLWTLTKNRIFGNRFFPGIHAQFTIEDNAYPIFIGSLLFISIGILIFHGLAPGLWSYCYSAPLLLWLLFVCWFANWFERSRLESRAHKDLEIAMSLNQDGLSRLSRFYLQRALYFKPELSTKVENLLVKTIHPAASNILTKWTLNDPLNNGWQLVAGNAPETISDEILGFSGVVIFDSPLVEVKGKKIAEIGFAYTMERIAKSGPVKHNLFGHIEILYLTQKGDQQRFLISSLNLDDHWHTFLQRNFIPDNSHSFKLRIVIQEGVLAKILPPLILLH